jgi:hypothetical protein
MKLSGNSGTKNNVNTVRYEDIRQFRNKGMEYIQAKNELTETQ